MTRPNGGEEASTPMPASLAARPHDPRRGLPIPPVKVHSDPVTSAPTVDFTNVNTTVSTDLAANRRCSLCGSEMGYWVAFVGGPRAAELMRYTCLLSPKLATVRLRLQVILRGSELLCEWMSKKGSTYRGSSASHGTARLAARPTSA